MGLFEDVVVNAKEAVNAVGKKAGQMVDISKLRLCDSHQLPVDITLVLVVVRSSVDRSMPKALNSMAFLSLWLVSICKSDRTRSAASAACSS